MHNHKRTLEMTEMGIEFEDDVPEPAKQRIDHKADTNTQD